MNILLDTHIILWFLEDNPRLGKKNKDLIENPNNNIFLSSISLLEISIKITIGKLILPDSLNFLISKIIEKDIEIVDLNSNHTIQYLSIPFSESHKDPFDRALIAIAKHEKLNLMTMDEKFINYKKYIKIIS